MTFEPSPSNGAPTAVAYPIVGVGLARALAWAVVVLAAVVLVGWQIGAPALRAVIPGLVPMMPVTALALLLLGGALAMLAGRAGAGPGGMLARAAALGAAAVGALTLGEDLFGWDTGLARLLFPGEVAAVWPAQPGRPAATTAFALILLGLGAWALPLARTSRAVGVAAQVGALLAASVAYVMVLGYAFDVSVLYAWLPESLMAFHTGIAVLALAVAAITATPGAGLPALFAAPSAGGRSMRRLAVPTLLGPIGLGALGHAAERVGLIPAVVALSLMVLFITLVGFGFLWWSAEAAARAEADLADLYENAATGYHSLDAEGRVVRINDTELAWLGRTREEVIGRHWATAFLTPASQEVFRATFPGFKARGWVKDVQFDIERADGTTFPVLLSATAVRDAAGRFVRSRSTLYDMTVRHRLEEALRHNEARIRAVLEASPDALLLVGPAGEVTYANAYAGELFGYAPGELVGLSIDQLVPGPQRAAHHDHRARFEIAGSRPMTLDQEVHGARRDGSTFPAEVRLSSIPNVDGPVIAVSVHDLTERNRILADATRRRLEAEQARELARVKDYLLSTISHELKTPVSLVAGYTELLEERYPDDEAVAGLMDGSQRLARHLNRIVDLGAVLGGTMPMYRSGIDPVELVEAAYLMVAPDIARARVRWSADVAQDLPAFEGDAHRLAQALAELLENACRFTPPGGDVGVRVEAADGRIALTVWDSGPGIAPEQLAAAWDAFNQVRTSDALRPGGLGLGLALVKGIVELHGGRIALECPPGGGTRARIDLPTAPATDGARPADVGQVREV